jgi:hypothetical protein
VVGRLNKSIANAPVIGEVELKQKQEKEGEEKSVDEAQQAEPEVEPRLVEGAPVEALSQLHRIGFVPLFELDRVLRHPEAMRHLSAREFEGFIATLVEQLGFEDVVLTPPSGDDGRDILATKRFAGMPVFFAFECKKYAPHRPVGPDIIRALLGTVRGKDTRANKGVLVTTSTFTPAARKFFVTEPDLEGRDFDDVVAWLKEYALARRNLGPE